MSNNSFWPTDRTLSSVTTPDQSEPGSNGNEGVIHIPQSFMAGAEPSDCWVSYPVHLLGKFYPSAEMQSMYSTAPADWIKQRMIPWQITSLIKWKVEEKKKKKMFNLFF